MIETAFKRLYPEKEFNYKAKLTYSKRFKDYNANIRRIGNNLEFSLSHEWKDVSDEIKIGLIQELFLKIFNHDYHDNKNNNKNANKNNNNNNNKNTINMDLYNNFIRSLHIAVPKTKTNPVLEDSFNRVNEKYFYGLVERPNLVWKGNSKTKLASYGYQNDTISVSNIFRNADEELIDYLIYHELLHKKLKYYHKNGKSLHHTKDFRSMESVFADKKVIDKKIENVIKSN